MIVKLISDCSDGDSFTIYFSFYFSGSVFSLTGRYFFGLALEIGLAFVCVVILLFHRTTLKEYPGGSIRVRYLACVQVMCMLNMFVVEGYCSRVY
jgi:hypothetical protein